MTVREFADKWLDLGAGRSDKTCWHNWERVQPFVRAHGDTDLRDVEPLDCQAWAVRHPGQVRYLKLMFADAKRLGLCAHEPFAGTRTVPKPKRDPTPPSEPELARIAAEASPLVREAIVLAAYTGLRSFELSAVERRDVLEIPSLRIVVREGKGGRRGDQVAVFGPAQDVVRDLVVRRDVGPLLLGNAGQRWTRWTLGKEWRAVRGDFRGTWHTLRAFHATWLLDRGASPLDVAVQMRHFDSDGRPNSDLVTKLYGRPDPSVALERLEAL